MRSAGDLRPTANSASVSSRELRDRASCGRGWPGSGLGAGVLLREDVCRVRDVEPEFQVPGHELPLSRASHARSIDKALASRNFTPRSEGDSHEMSGGRGGWRGG